jgi:hypothetical protein
MKVAETGMFDEIFTHEEDGQQTHYNASKLFEYCEREKLPVEPVPVEEHHARFMITNRGAEDVRIRALLARPEWLSKPILFVLIGDEYLLVDGTHRYVAHHILAQHYEMSYAAILAYKVPIEQARAFIVEDMPQFPKEVLESYSHIAELRAVLGGQP